MCGIKNTPIGAWRWHDDDIFAQGSFPLCDSITLPRQLQKFQHYRTIFLQQCYLNMGLRFTWKRWDWDCPQSKPERKENTTLEIRNSELKSDLIIGHQIQKMWAELSKLVRFISTVTF